MDNNDKGDAPRLPSPVELDSIGGKSFRLVQGREPDQESSCHLIKATFPYAESFGAH